MSHPSADPSGTRPAWVVVAVLLAGCIVVPLMVGLYDRTEPRLAGFPFFYWVQFLMIPIVSGLTYVAFRLSQWAAARERALRTRPAVGSDERGDR